MPRGRYGYDYSDPPERPADPAVRRAYLRRIVALFRPYRLRLAGVLGLILFSSILGSIPALLIKEVFDVALPEGDLGLLNLLVAGMIAIAIVTGALGVVQTLLSNQVGQRVMHDLRTAVYKHLQRLSLAFFTRTRTGEVQSRLANDIGGVQEVVTSTATSIVSNVSTVLATLIAMFYPRLAPDPVRAGAAAALRLDDEARRRPAPEGGEGAAGVDGRHLEPGAGVALGLGDPARQDDGADRGARAAASRPSPGAWPTSRCGAG